LEISSTAASFHILAADIASSVLPQIDRASPIYVSLLATVAAGLTAGQSCWLRSNNDTTAFVALKAEL
jgi:uncharacterized membrane protein YjjP (DUF1212 family)